jgi:glycosyltransferase involved in cell wall biosynthesis
VTAEVRPTPPSPLKIVSVIARLNVGGAAREVVLEASAAQDKGHHVVLVHGAVGPGEASLEDLAAEQAVRTIKIEQLGPQLTAFGDVRAARALMRVLFDEKPDVIHTHTAKAGALGRTCAAAFNALRRRQNRALVVHSFHGHVLEGYFGPVGNAAVRTAERALGLLTDVVVTISSRQRDDLVNRFRVVPARKAALLPYGLDLDPLLRTSVTTAVRDRLGILKDDVVLGYVGRFVPIKDVGTLVEAFAIAHRHAPRAFLVLAGDGPLRESVERRVAELHVSNNVRFVGWARELADLYNAFDICVLSSLNEGTPVAAIEAMALGKPVVATSVGGVPDVVQAGCGLLVPPSDATALAAAMLTLVQDPERRREFGATAKRHASQRFSRARLADDLDELYRDRLSRKRGTIVGTA